MVQMALIEIDGLPFLEMVIFHGYVSHNQMVYPGIGILRTGEMLLPGWAMVQVVRVSVKMCTFGHIFWPWKYRGFLTWYPKTMGFKTKIV